MRAVVEDLGMRQSPSAPAATSAVGSAMHVHPSASPIPIVGCPASDEAEELALLMLRQLLDPTRYTLEIVSAEMLTAEVLSVVEQQRVRLICVATLQPGALAPTRYLCKRLRARLADSKIVVGRWGTTDEGDALGELLQAAGADDVGTTLLETYHQLLQLSHLLASLDPQPTSST
jgi:hypothetical protein